MSAPTTPGWYDDPETPEQLRYFDGVMWTANVTPRRTTFAVPAPAASEAPPRTGPSWGMAGQEPARTPWPGTEPDPLTPAPLLPRVVAFVVDKIIVGVIGGLLGLPLVYQAIAPVRDRMTAAAERGDFTAAIDLIASADRRYIVAYAALGLAVGLVYHVVFLVKKGATPGKLMLGLRVRRLDRPGPLDRDTAIRRAGFEAVLSAMTNAPGIALIGVLLSVADVVWPLTDPRRQALHDKVAKTIVVRAVADPPREG